MFLLGTPNQGSCLADLQPLIEVVRQLLPKPRRWLETFTDGLGEAADDLKPESRFLRTLNAHGLAPKVRYYAIAGRKPFLTEEQRVSIKRELTEFLAGRQAPAAIVRLVEGLLDADELRQGRGDGAVTVRSALLAGAVGRAVFDLNHSELLNSTPESAKDDLTEWILQQLKWETVQK